MPNTLKLQTNNLSPPRSYKAKWMLSVSGVPYNSWNSHCIAYFCAEWGFLHDHLGDVSWGNIFKIGVSASELYEWIQFWIDA